jgi:hypothetical protein
MKDIDWWCTGYPHQHQRHPGIDESTVWGQGIHCFLNFIDYLLKFNQPFTISSMLISVVLKSGSNSAGGRPSLLGFPSGVCAQFANFERNFDNKIEMYKNMEKIHGIFGSKQHHESKNNW